MTIYQRVLDTLRNHGTYRPMLEEMKRCLRLNYAGQFHLDILPACPNSAATNQAILVPDCELECWMPSNPRGFAEWFFRRCELRDDGRRMLAEAMHPLPAAVPSDNKFVLQRVVQLMKRHRDKFFDGGTDIARSVILTTLAGHFYAGEQSLIMALYSVLGQIGSQLEAIAGVPTVPNPVNPEENFAESWNAEKYSRFRKYIFEFHSQVGVALNPQLQKSRELRETTVQLSELFGSSAVKEAIRLEAEEVGRARTSRVLGVSAIGALTSLGSRSTRVEPNSFYGR
jgi:hypothetical protein